jgi:general secretion pathway protein G
MKTLRAYTLIELLVVLVILGLLTGLVTPRLLTLYNRAQMAYQRDDVLLQLSHLNYAAWQQGRKFELAVYPDANLPLDLPPGWTLEAKPAIIYYPNGACSGGEVIARYAEETRVFQLEAPFCRSASGF